MTYSGIFSQATPVHLAGSETSYFSAPEETLDPSLFDGVHLRPWVRNNILSVLNTHLASFYENPQKWAHAWLAGSGVSYQWSAQRVPADLDCLVGIDYITFRSENPSFRGMSDVEISDMINDEFREHLYPSTANWQNKYELTFYVNPGATDITAINPYAAYDLNQDTWTVVPDRGRGPLFSRAWQEKADVDLELSKQIVSRYSTYLTALQGASNPAHRLNAESGMKLTLTHARDLYDEIHRGRKAAFSPAGAGYADFNNWRWQTAKQNGVISALKSLKEYGDYLKTQTDLHTYGIDLPSTDLLIRRAATYRQ